VTGGGRDSSGLLARTMQTRTATELGRRWPTVSVVLIRQAMAVLVLTPGILLKSAEMPKTCCRLVFPTWWSALLLLPFFAPEIFHDLDPYAPTRALVHAQGVAEAGGDIRALHIDKL
jgi:hypothetical protein